MAGKTWKPSHKTSYVTPCLSFFICKISRDGFITYITYPLREAESEGNSEKIVELKKIFKWMLKMQLEKNKLFLKTNKN